ncbi:arabinan endo-1,5-alpha-L-arabinosidase [Pelomyxa schiedti]|nr:arabinan endo-1,5-alpha-L-arabinosidase [Pelomyxa schiedti]
MRLRGWVTGFATLALLRLACGCGDGSYPTATFYPAQSSYHQTGSNYSSTAWIVTVNDASKAYMTYGPYTNAVYTSAASRVDFALAIDNNSADNLEIVRLEVNDATKSKILATLTLYRTDFDSAGLDRIQVFSLFFSNTGCSSSLEFRVYYYCCAAVVHYYTTVKSLDPGPLGLFWNNTAQWSFVSSAFFGSSMNVGFHFVPSPWDPSEWFLFHREYGFAAQPSYCLSDWARAVVRSTNDRGITWSDLTPIATPTANTADECAIVDGAGFYDKELNKWLYIAQCLDRSNGWEMCLYERYDYYPTGPFTPSSLNPVVTPGELWSAICSGTGKHCAKSTVDEGTPEIILKDSSGYYYVTFHGWDAGNVKSYRGVARTRDWNTWQTSGLTLPGDAMFSSIDCNGWDIDWAAGGCVGGGEGTIAISGDYYYQLIEAPDESLGCLGAGQNWVLGLMRSPVFGKTGTWEMFMVEPTVVPIEKVGCYIQYHRLFIDQYNNVFMEYWADNTMQIYQLVASGPGDLPIVAGPAPN